MAEPLRNPVLRGAGCAQRHDLGGETGGARGLHRVSTVFNIQTIDLIAFFNVAIF